MKPLFDPLNPNVIIFDRLDSTSNEADRMIKSGYADHGLIIWAREQQSGHGRYGRKWISRDGNLTFSVIINNDSKVKNLAIYPFLTALAIKDALLELNKSLEINFKWPNDILLHDKKIAGILYESKISGDEVNFLVCGIGLNITSSPSEINTASSLHEENIYNITADQIIFRIIQNMDKYFKLLEKNNAETKIYNLWLENAYKLGEELVVVSGNDKMKGKFETIEDGNLILLDHNERHVISTGDVFFSDDDNIITAASNMEFTNVTFLNINKNKNK